MIDRSPAQETPGFRFDRIITIGVVSPWRQLVRALGGRRGTGSLPILMYHSITSDPEPNLRPYYRLNTSAARFRSQMAVLAKEGYITLTLSEAIGALNAYGRRESNVRTLGAPGSNGSVEGRSDSAFPKIAVITFDDGFEDFRTEAWPILQEFKFTATMFLPTGFIGNERRMFKGRKCLTWDEVRELRDQGAEFGSHTVNHPELWAVGESTLHGELYDSKDAIERELKQTVKTFAHPFAFPTANKSYVQRFCAAAGHVGYEIGVTTALGRAKHRDNPLILKRLPINQCDDGALFSAKLSGAYDWVSTPQNAVKRYKQILQHRRARPGRAPLPQSPI